MASVHELHDSIWRWSILAIGEKFSFQNLLVRLRDIRVILLVRLRDIRVILLLCLRDTRV